MTAQENKVPGKAWVVTFAGMTIINPGASAIRAVAHAALAAAAAFAGLVRRPAMIPGGVARRHRGAFARDRKVRR